MEGRRQDMPKEPRPSEYGSVRALIFSLAARWQSRYREGASYGQLAASREGVSCYQICIRRVPDTINGGSGAGKDPQARNGEKRHQQRVLDQILSALVMPEVMKCFHAFDVRRGLVSTQQGRPRANVLPVLPVLLVPRVDWRRVRWRPGPVFSYLKMWLIWLGE